MNSRHSLTSLLRRAVVPALVLSTAYYLGYNLVQGERGLLAWTDINQELEVHQAELERLQLERQSLEQKVLLLRPDNLDPDMLDERARDVLGLAGENEVIIFLDDPLEE